ncbi:MAG: hypothetical protein ACLSB9_20650 [Hydrogeniiclostridium mannosilyticum]
MQVSFRCPRRCWTGAFHSQGSLAGIDVMEITFRTDAFGMIKLPEQCPDMLVGVGTVCSVGSGQAAEAGARFIVSPGFDPCVVPGTRAYCLPGCTPSEIM